MTLQSRILRLLAQPGVDKRLGKGRHYFPEAVLASYRGDTPPAAHDITATLWGLVARGLVYIDVSQSAPENWEWRLTAAGNASAKDENFNPQGLNPGGVPQKPNPEGQGQCLAPVREKNGIEDDEV